MSARNKITINLILGFCVSALLPAAAQAEIQQQAQVKILSTHGLKAKGKQPVLLDTYLSTRDPASTHSLQQPQAVATVRMQFPAGAKMNPIGSCILWPTNKPWWIAKHCAKAKVGEGWALVSNLGTTPLGRIAPSSPGNPPSDTGNYSTAPADCSLAVADQYSRTYQAGLAWNRPMDGLACLPRGYIWVHVVAYAGSGNGYVDPATGKTYDKTDPKKTRAAKLTDKTAIIFASDNGVAALSFAGSIKASAGGVKLSVDMPAYNSAGLKGWLPLDTDLVDFRLVINNPKYLAAGTCPRSKKWDVSTVFTYSPFPGDVDKGTAVPAPNQTVHSLSTCI